jgi:hypothetical protein
MFTKDELNLIQAFLNSDLNVPVKFADLVVSLKEKVSNELKTHDTTETAN